MASNGEESEFFYGIKNNASIANATPTLIVTKHTDGTYEHATVENIPLSAASIAAFKGIYNGQTFGVLGDSFAELNIYQPDLLSRLGIISTTSGIGGSCITGGTGNAQGDGVNRVPFVDRIVAMLANSITGIIVQGGSNDFHYNIALGTFGSTSTTDFYGALNFICDKIANRSTKIKAVFITPTFRGDSQFPSGTSGLANFEAIKPYVNAIKLVCAKYSIQVVDQFYSGINFYNTGVYTTDGVHPSNAAGKELYNNYLVANINAQSTTPLTLNDLANFQTDANFKKTIYFQKSGTDSFADAAIVATNEIDADFRIRVTQPTATDKFTSLATSKPNVRLRLDEGFASVAVKSQIITNLAGTGERNALITSNGTVAAGAALPKVYNALLNQSALLAPVATIVSNTLTGTPAWAYVSPGQYTLTLANAFPLGKTLIFSLIGSGTAAGDTSIKCFRNTDSEIVLNTTFNAAFTNILLTNASFKIEVYP
jgi:hypothetical protein